MRMSSSPELAARLHAENFASTRTTGPGRCRAGHGSWLRCGTICFSRTGLFRSPRFARWCRSNWKSIRSTDRPGWASSRSACQACACEALPPCRGLSRFPELNVRTYVIRDGIPGVWFFSLDAANPVAVWVARAMFHLPYFWATMRCESNSGWIRYESRRKHRCARPPRR